MHLFKANLTGAFLHQANLEGAYVEETNFTAAFLNQANLKEAYIDNVIFIGVYSSNDLDYHDKSFEERIKFRINKETDLSGIEGYDSKNSPLRGTPKIGAYTEKEAEEIIKEYNADKK